MEPNFLTLEDVLFLHKQEVLFASHLSQIRDLNLLDSAIEAPKASFEGKYLMTFFEMAATYIHSIAVNHPFVDGNKRSAALSGLTFLFLNGYELNESYDTELADMILGLLSKTKTKKDLVNYLQQNSKSIFE